ncbi:Putative ribonuclease H protein At1g65750 [Linum grandiflorum]
MLGKQGWKFLTNPNALVSRVFKAKYFPRGDFLSAGLGNRPSYVWRSIHAAQMVVREGCRWRLGDGRSIKVFSEPWLREEQNCYLDTVPSLQLNDLTVNDLLIPNLRIWDEHLLNLLFCDRDIQAIRSMPPPMADGEDDVRIWRFEKRGEYSVRSAYRVAKDRDYTTTFWHDDSPWLSLWRAPVQPKIKQLLWRILKGVASMRSNLQHRGVPVVDECAICSSESETAEHLFTRCSFATDCWRLSGLAPWVEHVPGFGFDFKKWLFEVIQSGAAHRIQQILSILWGIWRERNERVFNHHSTIAHIVVQRSLEDLREWLASQETNHHHQGRPPTCDRWHPPDHGYLKCNLDAAIFPKHIGLGLVIRDDVGRPLHYAMQRRPGRYEAREAEVTALAEALGWVRDMGYETCIFETDCQPVAQAVNGTTSDISEFGIRVAQCRAILAEKSQFTVNWVRRNRNRVAHELARRSHSLTSTILGEATPEWRNESMNNICFEHHH